jgi:DNA polymerase-3 subunit beta
VKIAIEKKDLYLVASNVYRAASTKKTIPVLSGLLIEVSEEKGMVLTATDMEIGIQATWDKLNIEKPGRVLVNAHYFTDFIKLLPDSLINMELDEEKSRLVVSYGRSSVNINTYQESEYPDLPLDKMKHLFSVPASVLKEALRKTSFSAASSHYKPVFTGVLLDYKEDSHLYVVATDTHRLAYYKYKLEGEVLEPFSFVIPTRTVNELLRIIDDGEEPINIGISGNNIIFYRDNLLLLSRLIEGKYPNYEEVIPHSFNSHAKMKSGVLINVLERARVMPTDDKITIQHITMEIKPGEIEFKSSSQMMGEIKELVDNIEIEGNDDFKISFNTNYFLDIMKVLTAENEDVLLNFSGSLGPAVIKEPEKENYLYVLVPMRTN